MKSLHGSELADCKTIISYKSLDYIPALVEGRVYMCIFACSEPDLQVAPPDYLEAETKSELKHS